MQSDFWKRFDNVLSGISVLKSDLQCPADRITEAEDRSGRAKDTLYTMHNTTNLLQEKCAILEKNSGGPGKRSILQQLTANWPPRQS